MERRFTNQSTAKVETREDGKRVITGVGSVFYDGSRATEYELMPGLYERIMPGAFDRAIRENDDVRGLFNHDPSHLLGRRSAGTLRLSVTARGLEYEIDAADTQAARDVIANIEAGNLQGSSFSFQVGKASWVEEEGRDIRQIDDFAHVYDVGPVTFPAYESTTAGVRSADGLAEIEAERAKWKADRDQQQARAFAMQARARLAEIGEG